MKLHFVRHGQTDFNIGHLAQGNTNNALNATGEAQAREVAKYLHGRTFDGYYVSPMRRALQTAEIITEGNVDFVVDDLLHERYFGNFEARPLTPEEATRITDLRLNSSENGIEPIRDLLARTQSFLDRLKAEHDPDAEILIVAHGALLIAMHHSLLGYDENTDLRSGRFENAELRTYDYDGTTAKVISSHRPEASLP